ncbi:class I SAM-dependent methyltransferase [Streptococcus uberis]|uniref:class I SAM-dependent methyltransferase n=1 Tax=Streptococcus uberis TaxID=1349 RepID=UPI0012B60194|nr:class I SAM-dependent methyltransferase [Streptococcus uberis]MTB58795.1 methyltransferase domain-containing protein [Streptococcus uberis]
MKLEQIKEKNYEQDYKNTVNDFFDFTYSKVYSELLDIELEFQINFLKNQYLIDKSNNFKVLDLCCGTGRHIKKLNEDNFPVDGVDFNLEAVKVARKNVRLGKVYLSDVQNFNPDVKYDLVYSMESSIGYLSDSKTIEIFKNINRNIISEKGTFILHLTNRDYLMQNLTPRIWFGNKISGYLLEDRQFNSEKGILKINQVRIIEGNDNKYSIDLRLYTLNEIKYLLNEAGLDIGKVYGNYDYENYSINSPYMIIECHK